MEQRKKNTTQNLKQVEKTLRNDRSALDKKRQWLFLLLFIDLKKNREVKIITGRMNEKKKGED